MARSSSQSATLAPDRTDLAPRAAAWSLWLVTIAAVVISVFVWIVQRFPAPPIRFIESGGGAAVVPAAVVYTVVFSGVGLILAHHQPRNPIGWMFLLIGLPMALTDLANRWLGPAVQTGSVTFAHELAAWLNSSLHLPWNGTLLLLILLVFPNGRLMSAAWRPAPWLVIANGLLAATASAFEPGNLFWYPDIPSPFAIVDQTAPEYLAIRVGAVGGTIAVTALAAFALVARYRASGADDRRRLKWIAYAGVILALIAAPYAVWRVLFPASAINGTFIPVVLLAATLLPLATVVAITRYRLYDIDILVNRTLTAAILAGIVAALFGVVSTVLERLSVALSGDQSDVALIASTLIVASVIGPVGRVVDRFIEQRVNPRERATGSRPSKVVDGDADKVLDELSEIRKRLTELERSVAATSSPPPKARRRKQATASTSSGP